MSHTPRWWLPLVALLAAPAVAAASDADARAALALAVAVRRSLTPLADEYARLSARAAAEGRPLLVWVGLRRPDLELARPDCLHYHCTAFPGAAAPCVVVGRPSGGELWRAADLPATAADSLRPTTPRVCGPNGCR